MVGGGSYDLRMTEIRPATPDDARAMAVVWREVVPFLVKSADGIAGELRSNSSRQVLVAVEDDEIAALASAWPPADGVSRIMVMVRPAFRRHGIGTALYDRIGAFAADTGATRMLAVAVAEGNDFAVRRGFALGRELSSSRVLLSDVPAPVAAPDGLVLTDYRELGPRDVYSAYTATAGDDPSGLSTVPPYDKWLELDWNQPDLVPEASVALLDGDTIASFVTTTGDRDRGAVWSALTGTRPAYRGRGLAKVVKSHALDRARAAGFTEALTGNAADNKPMLAVNHWLGYRIAGTQRAAEKEI